MTEIFFLILGLVFLFVGGHYTLEGIILVSDHYKLSRLIISSIVIGLGTSLPELIVSIEAILKNSTDIVIGNVIGSNIANTILVLGISAIIFPISLNDDSVKREFYWAILSIILTGLGIWFNKVNFYFGLSLLCLFSLYIWRTFVLQKKLQIAEKNIESIEYLKEKNHGVLYYFIISFSGIFFMILGGDLFLKGAIYIAKQMNISETVIGLTVVAIGTSLPELVSAIFAGIKKDNEIVLGNILGSTIFNLFGILGITSLIKEILVSWQEIQFDFLFMFVIYILLIILLMFKLTINRIIGSIMVSSYFAYLGYLYSIS